MVRIDGDISRKFFVGLDDGGAKRNNIYLEKGQEMGNKQSIRHEKLPATRVEVVTTPVEPDDLD